MRHPEKIMWSIFFSIILLAIIQIMGMFMGVELDERYPLFKLIFLGVPVILVVLHAFVTLKVRGLFFLVLAALLGFTSEYYGLKYGQFFGTYYTYSPQIAISTVPLQVIFYWAIFIYTGYGVTNSFLHWLHIKLPDIRLKNGWLLLLTILLDGWFILAIDLFMDPLEVRQGAWTWINGGPYFGVPIGNFIGWFVVAVLVSGIMRSIEYYFPQKKRIHNKSILIIPILCYGLVTISLMSMAVQLHMYELGLVGFFLMVPTVLFNLFLFSRYRSK